MISPGKIIAGTYCVILLFSSAYANDLSALQFDSANASAGLAKATSRNSQCTGMPHDYYKSSYRTWGFVIDSITGAAIENSEVYARIWKVFPNNATTTYINKTINTDSTGKYEFLYSAYSSNAYWSRLIRVNAPGYVGMLYIDSTISGTMRIDFLMVKDKSSIGTAQMLQYQEPENQNDAFAYMLNGRRYVCRWNNNWPQNIRATPKRNIAAQIMVITNKTNEGVAKSRILIPAIQRK
jgi:hypothetical protein